jgi:biopolymer transport protein ExbD
VNPAEQFFVGAAPVTLDELKARVGAEIELNPELRVFIRSDEEVPFRVNKKLMAACAEMGAINLIYSAFED